MGTARRKPGDDLAQSFPISIVIPVHNGARYLESCLGALARNDLEACQIVLVDDGSTDGSLELAKRFGDRLPLEILKLDGRSGPASARNRGAEQSRHPYLLFLDADVVLPERAILHFRETLDLYRHRPDIAGALGCYSEEPPFDGFFTHFKNLTTCHLYRSTETQSPFLHTAMLLIRKELFEEAGGFEEGLQRAEDFRLGLALGSRGYRFVIDWRIRGTHLKEYSLRDILNEDWRRIQALRALSVDEQERRFSLKAHRPGRLIALALPGPILVLAASSLVWGIGGVLAVLLLGLFVLVSLPFLFFVRRRRGSWFALRALAMLFLEMLWAEAALASSLIQRGNPGEARPASESAGPSGK